LGGAGRVSPTEDSLHCRVVNSDIGSDFINLILFRDSASAWLQRVIWTKFILKLAFL
jgi:hypothetical protein